VREESSVQASPSNGGDKWRKQALSVRLRAIMADKDLTVTATAKLVQERLAGEPFNAVNITHYRAGRSLPRPRILRALSDALGVDPQDLAPFPAAGADKVQAAIDGEVISEASPKAGRKNIADEALGSIPAFNLQDMMGGDAWLQINQRLSWPTVIKILQVLKGEDAEST
jgi:hypothetical protein